VRYHAEEHVLKVPDLDWGEIVPPNHEFSYFKQSSYRMDVWVLYLDGDSFLKRNQSRILNFRSKQIIDPKSSRNFILHFEDSNLYPEFDYNIDYDYYQYDSGVTGLIVEALYNENSGRCIVRVLHHFGDDGTVKGVAP
jgi:hypothetical protein